MSIRGQTSFLEKRNPVDAFKDYIIHLFIGFCVLRRVQGCLKTNRCHKYGLYAIFHNYNKNLNILFEQQEIDFLERI